MKFVVAIWISCAASTDSAGYANFTDGSLSNVPPPRFLICFDDVCDITTQDYVCSNFDSIQAGYAFGWTLDCKIADGREEDCTISWQGRAIDPAKHDRLTLEEMSE